MENPQWLPWREHRAERTKLGLPILRWMWDPEEKADRDAHEKHTARVTSYPPTAAGASMIAVSYAMTSDAFADGSKTETRRFWKPAHAAKFQPGREFMGWSKDPRAGGQRLHAARVVFCRPERLGDMSEDSFQREGGTRYWPDRAAYIAAMGGPDLVPYVLRFEHVWEYWKTIDVAIAPGVVRRVRIDVHGDQMDSYPPVVRSADVPPRAKADRISVRDQGGTYVARFRGKTASCTWSPEQAARAVAAKALGRLMVPVRCVVENRLYEIAEG